MIQEGDYPKQKIFSVDETVFYLKKMSSRTFIPRKVKLRSDFKASKSGWHSC